MNGYLKTSLSLLGVVVGASIAMQLPAALASQNDGILSEYTSEVQIEVSETPEPSPEVVIPSTAPSVIIIPPRMQSPDPRNPENGGNVGGGIVGRGGGSDNGPGFACARDLPTCPSKAP